jgi:hypothetical protein
MHGCDRYFKHDYFIGKQLVTGGNQSTVPCAINGINMNFEGAFIQVCERTKLDLQGSIVLHELKTYQVAHAETTANDNKQSKDK